MMKKFCFFTALTLVISFQAGAQQITRFAVVDISKVYTTFFKDSRAVREWEERSARFQSDIEKRTKEIENLQSQRAQAELQGESDKANRLGNEIYKKSEALKDWHKIQSAQLVEQKNKLSQSDKFYEQINSEMRLVAESEGFTMVLNLNDNKGILWYSPSCDITDKLIQSLQAKARR
ncbi:outer membrane protein [Spirochaetia bacterium]|nr:outer membrane protein [Spirochaetia bacterium]